jgi:hypothetical protein
LATTLCVPTLNALVLHEAVRGVPLNVPAAQIALPPSVKLTVPVGLLPVTVAVKVTLLPAVAGLGALVSVVVVAAALVAV